MSQPGLSPLSQSSKKTIPLQIDNPKLEMFWHSFTVFLLPFEKFCARRWYIFWLVYFATMFVSAFVTDLDWGAHYFHDIWFFFRDGHFQSSNLYFHSFTGWFFNAFITGLFLGLGLANYWQRSIPGFFQTLEQRCHLTDPQSGIGKSYHVYLTNYQRALLHGKGRVSIRPFVLGSVVFCSLIALTVNFATSIPDFVQSAYHLNILIAPIQWLWLLEENVFFPLFLIYFMISYIWIFVATGIYVLRFTKLFPLQIQLAHPDHCGGFKFLGNFAFNMAGIIIMNATLLAFYSIWHGYSFFSIGSSTFSLLLVVISYGAFFAPIVTVHQKMLRERNVYEESIALRTGKIEEQINLALKDADISRLKTAKEELEVVQALFPDTLGFPSWPFRWQTFITFLSSQIIPLISFAIGVSPVLLGFFAKVFPFLFRQ